MIDIRGLSKAAVLAALYNRAKVQGRGVLHEVMMPMEETTAQLILDVLPTGSLYVDYLYGRVIKVDLSSDTEFDERLYDRDNGEMINYLVYVPEFGVDIGNYGEPAKCWLCMGLPCKPTHWAHLPTPPKGE